MAFLVATTSLPAVYRPNGYARTTTAGTPHTRAKIYASQKLLRGVSQRPPHVVEGPVHPVYDRVQKNKLYNAWKYVIIFLIIS